MQASLRLIARSVILLGLSNLLGPGLLLSQVGGAGAAMEPRELKRPTPLCIIEANDPSLVTRTIVGELDNLNFVVTEIDTAAGHIAASRPDGDNADRVLIWLERNFQAPLKKYNVYLQYGRYQKFFGKTELKRVVTDEVYENIRIGALKNALARRSLQGGAK